MATYSINQMSTLRWSFEQDCFRYHEAGLSAIHVWREKIFEYGEAKGGTLLEELDLEVSALSWAGGFTGSDGRGFDDAVADGREAIRLAHELKAGSLIVYSGAQGGHIAKHAFRLFLSALDALIPLAEEHGVTLAIKPIRHSYGHDWTMIRSIASALDLISAMGSQHLKLALDLYEFADQFEVINKLDLLIPHLALVQIGDRCGDQIDEPNRCVPGEGQLKLEETIRKIQALGYNGPFDVELMGRDVQNLSYEEMLTRSIAYIQTLMNSV